MRLFPIAVAVLLLAGALPAPAQTPGLELVASAYRKVPQERTFDAVIEAVHRSTVSAQISGRIEEINFDVDDFVPKDAVLLRFRDREQRASLTAAQARYQEAAAEFARIEDIFEKKLVAKAAFDKAQADLKAAKANLDRAQEQLDLTVVRAPYSGIVTERHVELGETANAGQPLMTGLSLEALRARVQVPQGVINTLREQGQARVEFPFLDGRSVPAGRLTFFPYADAQSHTFTVRVELPPGEQGIYPGMFAKVAFVVGEAERLLVPAQAVAYRSEVTAVYVVDAQGRIGLRQVRLGQRYPDGMVEVLAGLSEGEQVALDPVQAAVYLKEQPGS